MAALAVVVLGLPFGARAALGPRYGGDLVVGLPEMPASLDPRGPGGTDAALLHGLVHETLVGVDAEGLPTPGIVERWTAGAGGREWRLRLRDGASFHDGRAVTSEDAMSALRRFLAGASPAGAWLSAGLDPAAPLAAPDPRHLVLRFREPRALPLAPLAARAAAVTGTRGSGCGPFVPLAPAPGRRIRLTPFGGHVRGRPYLDAVEVVALTGPEAVEAGLRGGKADVVPGPGEVSALAAMLVLALDPSGPPFDRPQSREAVAALVDRADMVARLLPGGDATPSLLPPSLLPALGRPSPARRGPLGGTVRMAVGADVPPLVSQRVVASLGAGGLRVEAKALVPTQARAARFAMRLFLWSPEVAEAGLALHELAALVPRPAEMHEAFAAAARELDLDRRRVLLHRAEADLRAEAVLIPIAAVPVSYRARGGIHGLRVDPTGRLVLEDAWREP